MTSLKNLLRISSEGTRPSYPSVLLDSRDKNSRSLHNNPMTDIIIVGITVM